MRRHFMYGTVFAAAMAVGVAAQTPSSQGSTSRDDHDKKVTVTGCLQSADHFGGGDATGSTAGTTGTSGTTGTTSSMPGSTAGVQTSGADQFILTNVSMGGDTTSGATNPTNPGEATSPQPGVTGTTGSASSAFRLVASSGRADWSKYLNHRVEVKGTLSQDNEMPSHSSPGGSTMGSATGSTEPANPTNPANPTGSSSGSTATTSPTPGWQTGSHANLSTLHVTSIREISGSCAPRR